MKRKPDIATRKHLNDQMRMFLRIIIISEGKRQDYY